LDDELENLQSMWQGDKVAEVYLQGLKKIGNYIRTKGAYAHPNSIKLLLTFFYNFEKIISSEQVTGEQITQLLKADVRKFKILQYQITQSEIEPSAAPEIRLEPSEALKPDAIAMTTDPGASKQLKAAVLSLDWEVTDESLQQFNKTIAGFHGQVADNKPALVLVQGLQALGDYIADERADAHPEAFILLHAFSEALEQVLQTGDQALGQDKIQDLLVDRINRLNNLKLLIAAPSGVPVNDQRVDEVFEEFNAPSPEGLTAPDLHLQGASSTSPASLEEELGIDLPMDAPAAAAPTDNLEAEIDTFFTMDAMPAMESADVQYPDEVLPPDAIQPVDDELADDFIESQLSSKRGLMPALSDADETSGFDENAQPFDMPTQSDLSEQLDFLFADAEAESALSFSALDSTDLELAIGDEEEPIAAIAEADAADDEQDTVEAALSDAEEPEEQTPFAIKAEKAELDLDSLDIQNKLDSFFAESAEEPEEAVASPQTEVDEIEQSLFFNEEDGVQAALADSDEERGFSEEAEIATLSFTPMEEIEEKLDFFFGTDVAEEPAAEEFASEAAGYDSLEESLGLRFEEPETEPDIAPALAGFSEQEPAEEKTLFTEQDQPEEELEATLDFFFADSPKIETEPVTAEVDELTMALEATIDDRPQEEPSIASAEIQLAALGALLPGVVRTPSRKNIAESAAMIATLKQAELSTGQQSLVQLLDAVLTMLVRLPTKDGAATEKLVNYLYEQLIAEHGQPDLLPEAIARFTAWLHQASTIMPVVPTASDQERDPQFAYTAKELYFELSELRAHIREEFAKLRHEMHHHK
jgi:pilus assembly protein FimV